MARRIEIYGLESCRFTAAAIGYCQIRGYPFAFHDLADPATKAELLERAPLAVATPQIFLDGERIGGLTSLQRKDDILGQLFGANT